MIIEDIRTCADNGQYLSPGVTRFLLDTIAQRDKEIAGIRRVMKTECEDWAECHTFLQNAGIQMDPVDSYSGATCLIDGIKLAIAQRYTARSALARFGRHEHPCGYYDATNTCTCGFTAALEVTK